MGNKSEDLFDDEAVTVTLKGGVSSFLGETVLARRVSKKTALKVFRLLTKKIQLP